MRIYDVCVIGSGAAGGVMAKELCEGGAEVIMLEAGEEVPPSRFLSHKWPYELPFRGLRGERQAPFYPKDISAIRYQDTDSGIGVDRVRVLGGRTLHWNAVTLRYAPRDFRERSLAGVEEDWPLSYEDLEPWYEHIEQTIGVCGQDDHLEILPAGKHYLPVLPWRRSEHILARVGKSMGISVIPVRKAVLTVPYDQRPPCHYCGHCMDGCDVSSIFTTPDCMLPKARATGRFTLRQNAVAREVLTDASGRAQAVSFIDRATRREEQVQARVFAVCCATIESARLLLNSKSARHPDGLGNSSGVIGRYLHGHIGGGVSIYLDELAGTKPVNQDGATDHVYVPRYNHVSGKRDYAGGWGIQVNFDSYMFPDQAQHLAGYGAAFKSEVRRLQPGYLFLGTFCKALASPGNYVTVDPDQTDAYGIPIPIIHYRRGENDRALWRDQTASVQELASRLKGTVFSNLESGPGGFASHEVGTVRMGKDSQTSALNGFCQSHEVKNLFVTDGSAFTTSSEKNPTLTIMALSARAADYIKRQRKLGAL
jgi:choline dehydrogenase-like flavoprotein